MTIPQPLNSIRDLFERYPNTSKHLLKKMPTNIEVKKSIVTITDSMVNYSLCYDVFDIELIEKSFSPTEINQIDEITVLHNNGFYFVQKHKDGPWTIAYYEVASQKWFIVGMQGELSSGVSYDTWYKIGELIKLPE